MSTLVSRQAYSRAARGMDGQADSTPHGRAGVRVSGRGVSGIRRNCQEMSQRTMVLPRDGVVKFHRSTGASWPVAVLIVALVSACSEPPTPMPTPTPPPSPSTPTPPPSPPSLPVDPANVVFLPTPAAAPFFPADPIVGRYTLEIVAGSGSGQRCGAVPDYAKRRTYTADIHDLGGSYAVKLYDATFLRDGPRIGYGCSDRRLPPGGVCHQFLMTREGNVTVSVTMTPEDEWRGSEIWEVLPDGYLLADPWPAPPAPQVADGLRRQGPEAFGTATVSRHQTPPDAAQATCT